MSNKTKIVYSNKWFKIVSEKIKNYDDPFYTLQTNDFVSIFAINKKNKILLVKQYRPALKKFTLEFPSGHVEKNEKPNQSAKKELLEETGYEAKKIKLLKTIYHDTARLNNKLFFYHAKNIQKIQSPENGIKLIELNYKELFKAYEKNQLNSSMSLAMLYVIKKLI